MAHILDDRAYVTRLDPKEMYRLTAEFPNQCRRAHSIAQSVQMPSIEPTCVMLTGLGGSAAGGDFARAIFDAQASIPFTVNRDYHLPNWVQSSTLVIASSYSGNTEETLSAYADARRIGTLRLIVTGGGKLADFADIDQVPLIQIPAGQPPRTALGFMLIPVLHASVATGLLPAQPFGACFDLLDSCVQDWGIETPFEDNPAKQLAAELHGAVSVLYGLGGWQGLVANRWKGQINENAKNMTFANSFPELNHNEILGWANVSSQNVDKWVAVVLEDGHESPKMQARRDVTAGLISSVAKTHRMQARGETLLEKMLSLVLLGDFVSLYLAALNGVDPENIDAINVLKKELASVN